jgi:DNA-binding transcriptional LysR family regulator
MEHLHLDKLKLLLAVKNEGSINAAAEKLYVAKSYISRTIKEMERDLGFKLLDRSSYRAVLSDKAEMYLARAAKILEFEQELESLRTQLSEDVESHIRVSSTVLFSLENLISLVKDINHKFPNTSLDLEREVLSGEQLLLNKSVDIGIIENLIDEVNLEAKLIDTVMMPLVISSDHEFLKLPRRQQNIQALQNHPQISLKSTIQQKNSFGGIYQDSRKWQVNDNNSKLALIRAGLGWGRMPDYLVHSLLSCGELKALHHIEEVRLVKLYLARHKFGLRGRVCDYIWQKF